MVNEQVLGVLTGIARDAAAVLMQGWRVRGGVAAVEFKGAVDLVTAWDRASEALIRERISQELPDFDLVAEEGGGERHGDRPVIWADPLDGTTNFAHGHPFFAVSLGVYHREVPLAAVVLAPALGWTFTALRGAGAWRNGQRCAVSATTTVDKALLATGFPYDRRTSPENNLRAFVAVKKLSQGLRRCGSAALDLCLVADGTYDGYWELKLKPWDLAAGALLVLEAGGTLSDPAGGPFRLAPGNLVATNGHLHTELLTILRSASEAPGL